MLVRNASTVLSPAGHLRCLLAPVSCTWLGQCCAGAAQFRQKSQRPRIYALMSDERQESSLIRCESLRARMGRHTAFPARADDASPKQSNPQTVFLLPLQVLSAKYATSVGIITRLMDGAIPACPRINFCVVDVRDVADLHLLAMTSPKAAGERFLATAVGGAMGMKVRVHLMMPTATTTPTPTLL